MAEPALKTFGRRADQLYERGVAAAKGGQRTVATGLLRQAVRLNPQHEQAWLWLGGVLADPEDVDFCLRSVLQINPQNEHARHGLAQLAERPAQAGAVTVVTPRPRLPVLNTGGDQAPAAWWVGWRDAQHTWRLAVRILWLIPLLLITTTVGIRAIVVLRPLPTLVTYRDLSVSPTHAPGPAAKATATPAPTETSIPSADPAVASHYIEAVRGEQVHLQQAIQYYRKATQESRTTVERVAAARTLGDELNQGRAALQNIAPPRGAGAAHAQYLEGLFLEGQALQDLLTFYSSYDVSAVNRAALRLQDARSHIDAGKTEWQAFAQLAAPTAERSTLRVDPTDR